MIGKVGTADYLAAFLRGCRTKDAGASEVTGSLSSDASRRTYLLSLAGSNAPE
jgi:hypothetical protein